MPLSESAGPEPPSTDRSRHRVFVLNPMTQRMIDLLFHLEENKEYGPWPASKASIDALAVVEVTEPGKECAICLEEYEKENQDQVSEMPCKHNFHQRCVEKWLKMNGSCPICRSAADKDNRTSAEADGRVTFVFVSSSRMSTSGGSEANHEAEGSRDESPAGETEENMDLIS